MSASPRPLRAALIGLGAMGRNHARVLLSLDDADLVAIHDPQLTSPSYLGVPILPDIDSVIGLGIDFAVIATPTGTHLDIARHFADAGVPCLIEKPLASTAEEAQEIANAFEARGVPAAVGQIERFNPAIMALRAHLEAGTIGEVVQVATRRLSPLPTRITDVGVALDLATHDIDTTRFVTGAEYQCLNVVTRSMPGRTHEDAIAAVGEMTDGAMISHLVNWVSPLKERVTVVTGAKGLLIADTLFADLTLHSNGERGDSWVELAQFGGVAEGDVIKYALKKTEPLRSELDAFIALVRGQKGAICSLTDGTETVKVAQQIAHVADTRPEPKRMVRDSPNQVQKE